MAALGSKVLQIRSVEFAGGTACCACSKLPPWDIPMPRRRSGTLIHLRGRRQHGTSRRFGHRVLAATRAKDQPARRPTGQASPPPDPRFGMHHRHRRHHHQNVSHDGRPTSRSRCIATTTPKTIDLLKTKVLPATGAAEVAGDQDLQGLDRPRHRHAFARRRGEQDVPYPLGRGINIQMITTSEIKTSVVIDEKYMELAVRLCTRRSSSSRTLP